MDRFELRHPTTQEEKIKHLSSEQQADTKHFLAADGAEYEVMEKKPLLEWLTENYTDFGCKLSFITDKSQEGAQFCQGLLGIFWPPICCLCWLIALGLSRFRGDRGSIKVPDGNAGLEQRRGW